MVPVTSENAPAGYVGPVCLTAAQKARTAQLYAAWVDTLRRQAADASDPETQANAVALLARRGVV